MSFTRNDLLKIYVPFVDVTDAANGFGIFDASVYATDATSVYIFIVSVDVDGWRQSRLGLTGAVSSITSRCFEL